MNLGPCQNDFKGRPRSFSSSTVEKANQSNVLNSLCGATKERDNNTINDNNKQNVIDTLPPIQRRGSSPSKFHSDQFSRLSPPVVRVNSPQNNEDLDAVEKHLGDMLEATIASIESGIPFKPKDSLLDENTFTSGGQLVDIDDEDSPLSFFTGSFNYFFRPRKRYTDNSYHQPAQYASWSSDISSADQHVGERDKRKRPSVRDIGRTQSLEPSWTIPQESQKTSSTSEFSRDSSLFSETSGFDTEDQIDEYMMMLHSNPELFLASVRKGCVSSQVQNLLNVPRSSTNARRNRRPSMKEIDRAQTLDPSWTVESSPTEQRYSELGCSKEHDVLSYNNDYESHDTYVRKTQSFPESEVIFCNSADRTGPNEAWTPTIIVTPPSRSGSFITDVHSGPASSIYGRKVRSRSLAPIVETRLSEQEEAIKLRKFLSHDNLITKGVLSIYPEEYWPSRTPFDRTEDRRFIDRYYASISSKRPNAILIL